MLRIPILRAALSLLVFAALAPTRALAAAPAGPPPGSSIRADEPMRRPTVLAAAPRSAATAAPGRTVDASFVVRNNSGSTRTFSFAVASSDAGVASVGAAPRPRSLAAGQSVVVAVPYTVRPSAAGAGAQVTLTATDAEEGTLAHSASVQHTTAVVLAAPEAWWNGGGSNWDNPGQAGSATIRVTNNSNTARTLCFNAPPYGRVTPSIFSEGPTPPACRVFQAYETVNPMTVTYRLRPGAPAGEWDDIHAQVYDQADPALNNYAAPAWIHVYVNEYVGSPSVGAPAGQTGAPGESRTAHFTVQNNSNSTRSFSFAAASSNTSVAAAGSAPGPQTLTAGQSITVPVPYTVQPSAAGSAAQVTLTATDTGDGTLAGSAAMTHTTGVKLAAPEAWWNGGGSNWSNPDQAGSASIRVTNHSNTARTLCFNAPAYGRVTPSIFSAGPTPPACRVFQAYETFNPSSTPLTVTYTVRSGAPAGEWDDIHAQVYDQADPALNNYAAPAWLHVYVNEYVGSPTVAVTAHPSGVPGGTATAHFDVRNNSNSPRSFSFAVSSSDPAVAQMGAAPATLSIGAGQAASVSVTYGVNPSAQGTTAQVTLRATDTQNAALVHSAAATHSTGILLAAPEAWWNGGGSSWTGPGQTGSATLRVANRSNAVRTLCFTAPAFGRVTPSIFLAGPAAPSCRVFQPYETFNPETGPLTVTYTVRPDAVAGVWDDIQARVHDQAVPSLNNDAVAGWMHVYVTESLAPPTVTPGAASSGVPGSTQTAGFTVRNNSNARRTFTLSVLQSDGAVVQVGAAPGPQALDPGQAVTVQVPYTVRPSAAGSTAKIILGAADSQDGALWHSAEVTHTTAELLASPTVTAPAAGTRDPGTYTAGFTLTNNSNVSRTFAFSVSSSDVAVIQAGAAPQAQEVPAGQTVTVGVPWTLREVLAGSTAQVTLVATDTRDAGRTHSAAMTRTVATLPRDPAVTAPPAQSGMPGAERTASFTVENRSNASRTFLLFATSSSTAVVGDPADPAPLRLAAFESRTVPVPYTPLKRGSATVRLAATDSADATRTGGGEFVATVLNRAPAAELTFGPADPVPGEAIRFDASGSTDPDGDPLTYSWNFGDGRSYTGTETPISVAYAAPGSYRFVVQVSDGQGGTHADTVQVDVVADTEAPGIAFSPGSGTFNHPEQAVEVVWTDARGMDKSSLTLRLNGQEIPFWGTNWIENTWARSTNTLHLAPGPNTLVATIRDRAGNVARDSVTYTFNAFVDVEVGASVGLVVNANTATAHPFQVTNTGTVGANFRLNAWCTGALSGCALQGDSLLYLPAGTTLSVPTAYTTGQSGTGLLWLKATATNDTTITAEGSLSVNITGGEVYGVSVTPDGATVQAAPSSSGTYSFTVTNTGNQRTRFAVAAGCGDQVVVTTCSAAGPSIELDPGESRSVPVSYTTAASGNGPLGLNAGRDGDASVWDSGIVTVQIGAGAGGSVPVVTPLQTGPLSLALGASMQLRFQVRNPGSAPATYALSAECTPGVLGCVLADTSISVNPGSTQDVEVTVRASGAIGGPGSVKLVARDGSGLAGHGSTAVSVGSSASGGGVRVTPAIQVHTVGAGEPGMYTFQVRNFGGAPGRFTLEPACVGAVTGCGTLAPVDLAPGETRLVTVSFTAGSAGADAELRLTATHASQPGVAHTGRALLDIQAPGASGRFAIAILPGSRSVRDPASLDVRISWAAQPCSQPNAECDPGYRTWEIRLDGTDVKPNFRHDGVDASGRTDLRQTAELPLQPGLNRLVVTVCGIGSECGTATQLYYYDPQSDTEAPQITVFPGGGNVRRPSLTAYVYLKDNGELDLFQLRIRHGGSPVTDYGVQRGYDAGSATVTLGDRTLAGGRNTFWVEVCDAGGNCAEKETVYYLDAAPPAVAITPQDASTEQGTLAAQVAWTDDADLASTRREILFNGIPLATGPASGTSYIDTPYLVLVPGLNTLVARICDGVACAEKTAEFFHHLGDKEKPRISAAPTNQEYLNTAQCAVDCFEVTTGYATPAFVLKDVPRSAGLAYRSGQANPRVTVEVDVTDVSRVQPSSYTLRLLSPAGAFVPFTSGADAVTFPAGRRGTFRLAGQLDVSGMATGVYDYTAVVTTYWADDTFDEARVPVRVLVVNEKDSPFGAGWSMPGLQRLHFVTGGILLTEGDGSAALFRDAGAATSTGGVVVLPPDEGSTTTHGGACGKAECVYTSPTGDFSELTLVQRKIASDTTLGYEPSHYLRRYLDGTTLRFDLMGRLTSLSDRLGNATQYAWQAGRLTHVRPREDLPITLGYDGRGKLSTIQDPMGRVTTFTIDAAGDLTAVEEVASAATATSAEKRLRVGMGYTAHRLTSVTDAGNATSEYAYDRAGKLERFSGPWVTTRVDGVEKQERLVTKFSSREAALLPAAGSTSGPLLRSDEVAASVTDPLQQTTRFWTDRFGSATRVTDHKGNSVHAYRDGQGRDTLLVSANGDSTRLEWDGALLRKQHGRPNGGSWESATYTYGAYGLVAAVDRTVPGAGTPVRVTTNVIEPGRGLVTESTSYGRKTGYEYTADWRLRKVTDPGLHTVEYTYGNADGTNPWGNLETVTDQNGNARYQYDAFGREKTVTNALGHSASTVYDLVNRPVTVTDANQQSTTREYDGVFVRKVRDAKGRETEFVPNAVGWTLQEIVREPGRSPNPLPAIHYAYDLFGRITETTNRRNQTVRFRYDAQGRLEEQRVLADGSRTTWSYAANDSTVTVTQLDGAGGVVSRDVTWIDPDPKVRETGWKPLSVAVSEVTRGSRTYVLESIAHEDGMDSSLLLRSPDLRAGETPYEVRYDYERGQGLVGMKSLGRASPIGDLTSTGTGAEGALSQITLPTGSTSTEIHFRYPATHSVGSITYTNAARPELQRKFGIGYEQDAFGRIKTRTGEKQTDDSREFRRYDYDPAGRLKAYEKGRTGFQTACGWHEDLGQRCTRPYGSTTEAQDTFVYDAVGNRTNRGETYEGNLLTGVLGYTLEYDEDGNLKRKYRADGTFGQVLEWNALGQLTRVATTRNAQSQVTTYAYDGLGRRIRKETAGVVREYIYNGDHLVLEVDGQGRDLAEYVYYPGVDAPHSMRRRDAAGNWRTYYYLTEAPGHVAGLIDETGQVVREYAYTPFGEITETTPAGVAPVENPLTYTAREWDAEVGLYFYRARYYDPVLQRFVSEDPIGLAGGLNPYAYVGNDPINASDPSGLCTKIWWGRVLDNANLDSNLYVMGWSGCWLESGGDAGPSWRSDRGASYTRILNGVQTGLDVAGLVPGAGEAADLVNAGIYFARGDNVNGGLSLTSAIPFIGWGGTVGKLINRANDAKHYIPDVDRIGRLRQVNVSGVDIPLPDPRAGGAPHTVLGAKVSETGVVYRQSATFTGNSWPPLPGYGTEVPLGRVDWYNHGRPDHFPVHIHPYSWNGSQWIKIKGRGYRFP